MHQQNQQTHLQAQISQRYSSLHSRCCSAASATAISAGSALQCGQFLQGGVFSLQPTGRGRAGRGAHCVRGGSCQANGHPNAQCQNCTRMCMPGGGGRAAGHATGGAGQRGGRTGTGSASGAAGCPGHLSCWTGRRGPCRCAVGGGRSSAAWEECQGKDGKALRCAGMRSMPRQPPPPTRRVCATLVYGAYMRPGTHLAVGARLGGGAAALALGAGRHCAQTRGQVHLNGGRHKVDAWGVVAVALSCPSLCTQRGLAAQGSNRPSIAQQPKHKEPRTLDLTHL